MDIKAFLFSLILFLIGFESFAQAHRLEFKINDFSEKEVYLGYHYGDKQYIKDTLTINSKGVFVKEGEEPLDGGVYLAILPPESNYFEVLIGSNTDQNFALETSAAGFVKNMQVKGSDENKRFYDYLNFVAAQKAKVTPLQEELEKEKDNKTKKEKIAAKIDAIDQEVDEYQANFINNYPESLGAAIINASRDVETAEPDPKMSDKEKQEFQFYEFRKHFFDNLDLSDPRLMRSPVMHSRVERYLDKLTFQIPDSLSKAVDHILELTKGNEETFKYLLVHSINKYATSKTVGMDAVYVHIVDKYYAKGKAPWTDEAQLKKILKNARQLKPLLIGKKAPNIKITRLDNEQPIELYDVEADFTIVYFWDPNCGHCKKQAPLMVEEYNKYKDKNIVMFSICTKDKERDTCMDSISEKDLGNWLNTMATDDSHLYYRLHYNIKSTPQLYILDKDKTIKFKRIGAEQLSKVLDMLIANDGD